MLAMLLALATAGCKTTQPDFTGSLSAASAASAQTEETRTAVDAWGDRYRAKSTDPDTAIGYAQALRAIGQRAQAVAVLEQASLHNPKHIGLLGAYGRALADNGTYKQALDVLNRAHTPDQPDWRILSVQGAVLDQMGRHEEAQRYYATALRIRPDEPSVLSNLGLSYALSKDLVRAESTLRRASVQSKVDPRVRQNLALVVGLQGRFQEAESIAQADLPTETAAANVAYLRQMLAQQNGMKQPGERPKVQAKGS
ncbi:MAG: tetratricopeptide repeat protein [Xanthobacteraceae bacterium]